MIHNYYIERGGEDISFDSEVELLQKNNHDVSQWTRHNHIIKNASMKEKIGIAKNAIWSASAYAELSELIYRIAPDLVHLQNTFPLISPAAIYACKNNNVPVVQTIRNFRLLCSNALFFFNQKPCELCLKNSFPFHGIIRGCYHGSRIESAGVGLMLAYHNLRKTWKNNIDVFITLTDFSRNKFISAGYPEAKLLTKPNFVEDPGYETENGEYVLFTGRLTKEKGVLTLLEAWKKVGNIPLVIIGDGPLENEVMQAVRQNKSITYLNHLAHHDLMAKIQKSKFVIFPSEWYETFGRVIIESYACGKPVIASRLGAMAELVRDGDTGLLLNPGDPDDLAMKVIELWNSPDRLQKMKNTCRKEYKSKYTPETNYEQLMRIYQIAAQNHNSSKTSMVRNAG